jgi:hypothetical protein
MRRAAVVLSSILFGLCLSTAEVLAADVGRYQVVVVRTSNEGMVALRIDTTTGKTWVLDTITFDLADNEYLKRQGMQNPQIQELLRTGWVVAVPSHWKEVNEQPVGVNVRQVPK